VVGRPGARAIPEYARALAYCLTLVFLRTLPVKASRVRWMVIGLTAAIVGIRVIALVSRTLPDVLDRVSSSTRSVSRIRWTTGTRDYWPASAWSSVRTSRAPAATTRPCAWPVQRRFRRSR
jgi:hypothetical protein